MRRNRVVLWALLWILAVALLFAGLIAVLTDPDPGGPPPRYDHCVITHPGVEVCS